MAFAICTIVLTLVAIFFWVEARGARETSRRAWRRVRVLEKHLGEREDEIRRALAQLNACATAALGAVGEDRLFRQGQFGWSTAYRDVVDLRREVEAMRIARDHATGLLREGDVSGAHDVLAMTKHLGVEPLVPRVEPKKAIVPPSGLSDSDRERLHLTLHKMVDADSRLPKIEYSDDEEDE